MQIVTWLLKLQNQEPVPMFTADPFLTEGGSGNETNRDASLHPYISKHIEDLSLVILLVQLECHSTSEAL